LTKENTKTKTEENSLATTEHDGTVAGFQDEAAFKFLKEQGQILAGSGMVPAIYQGKPANCIVALEMASRTGASPLAVMQNLDIIKGKPSWSSKFIIGVIESVKGADGKRKFSDLRYVLEGKKNTDERSCYAWVTELATGERLEGPPVTIAMAKAEKWYQKDGSKWKTMPELMIRYRAAAFFGRLYVSGTLMGMLSQEEVRDITDKVDVFVEPEDGKTRVSSIVTGQATTAKEAAQNAEEAGEEAGEEKEAVDAEVVENKDSEPEDFI